MLPAVTGDDRTGPACEVGIAHSAHSALVEPGPPVVLTELVLVDGAYSVRAEHRGRAEIDLGVCAAVDLDALDR